MRKSYLITLFLFISIVAFSQSNTKKEKIMNLLEVTNMGKQAGIKKIDYLLTNLKQKYKNNVDEKFWDTFRNSINVDDLVNLMVEIYDKYYTEEDIDKLIDFYISPLGKKVLKNTPIIFMESMEAGQNWEKEIFEKAKKEILLK